MLRQSCLTALLGLSVYWGGTASAIAQQSDGSEIFYEYARNKIGLLRYCRDKAVLGQVTADRAAKAIEIGLERLAISDGLLKERGDRAEKAGERGFWEANGQYDIASVAALRNTTLADLCKELGGQTKAIYQAPIPSPIVPKVKTPAAVKVKAPDVVKVKAPDVIKAPDVVKVKAPDVVNVKAPDAGLIIDILSSSGQPADPPSAPAKAADPAPWVFPICN